ncbi:MAG: tetratricopeptide repeat protein [Chloroflexota bacterium]|nr:tetratricopeptide repeat protein [Chloroflexota bacterium]
MSAYEDSYFAHGLRLMDAGDYEGAVAMFDNALKLGLGDLAAIHVCRGEALAYLGKWGAAEDSVNEALGLQPYLAAAYNARGNIYRFQSLFDKAINDYTMAIHIEPDYDEAFFNRALAYEARRRYAEAEADLTQALRINPKLGQAYEARGRARAKQFKYDLAVADISAYLKSGAAREFDNHSEMQGYLIVLQVQRILWRLLSLWRRA